MSYDFIVFLFAPAEGPMCDFCSGTPVVATHCCSPSVKECHQQFISTRRRDA